MVWLHTYGMAPYIWYDSIHMVWLHTYGLPGHYMYVGQDCSEPFLWAIPPLNHQEGGKGVEAVNLGGTNSIHGKQDNCNHFVWLW